jgi:hypothetical protein
MPITLRTTFTAAWLTVAAALAGCSDSQNAAGPPPPPAVGNRNREAPDRRSIAIDLLGGIWILPASGCEAKRITPELLEARQPTWSPDGKSILGATLYDVAEQAEAAFGPGNFLYKIGEKAVGKWR